MQIITKPQIEGILTPTRLVEAIEAAFVAFSSGKVRTPPVGYMSFTDPPGDMHIKYGQIQGDDVFVVKLATGFYENPKINLPSSNGLLLVLSAKTGTPLALINDEGSITDTRTAAAGVVASRALARRNARNLGVVGTGIQARLQIQYHHTVLNLEKIFVWGRDSDRTDALIRDLKAQYIDVTPAQSIKSLCENTDIIVTTTPSTKPIVRASDIREGTHITAIGADAPGKQELDPDIFAKAAFVCFDSQDQCLHHGESSHAAVGLDTYNSAELGTLLEQPNIYSRSDKDITIADLTGIVAQDIAAAKLVWNALKEG